MSEYISESKTNKISSPTEYIQYYETLINLSCRSHLRSPGKPRGHVLIHLSSLLESPSNYGDLLSMLTLHAPPQLSQGSQKLSKMTIGL